MNRRHAWRTVGGVASILALAGCRTTGPPDAGLVLFPAPPAEPRIQFLTWASGADQVEPGRTDLERFVLGEEPVVQRAINKPYGIAARDGIVYVCDTKGLSIGRLDFVNRRYSVFGHSGPGRLRKPLNIVIDPLGYKFVVDSVRKQVVVFSPEDKYVSAFSIPEPCHPVDLALHEDELYVLDNDDTCQVLVLNRKTGEVIRTFGGPGGEPGQFKIPGSIDVAPDGHVYISDTHNWRIQKLTADGEPVWVQGGPGYTLGSFGRPRGIKVGPDGIIYVVDGATELIQMFDSDGNVLMRFGGPGNAPGALGLPATLAIDATSLPHFRRFIHKDFTAEYLLFVTSQYGERLVSIYALGRFPEGYEFSKAEIADLPRPGVDEGIGPVQGEPPQAEPSPQTPPEPGTD